MCKLDDIHSFAGLAEDAAAMDSLGGDVEDNQTAGGADEQLQAMPAESHSELSTSASKEEDMKPELEEIKSAGELETEESKVKPEESESETLSYLVKFVLE